MVEALVKMEKIDKVLDKNEELVIPEDVLNLLFQQGKDEIDLNSKDRAHQTGFHYACEKGREGVVKVCWVLQVCVFVYTPVWYLRDSSWMMYQSSQ